MDEHQQTVNNTRNLPHVAKARERIVVLVKENFPFLCLIRIVAHVSVICPGIFGYYKVSDYVGAMLRTYMKYDGSGLYVPDIRFGLADAE